MWSRIVEAMLACWLAVRPFVFAFGDDDALLWINALAGAALVLTLSLASLARRFDKAHLGIYAVSAWLAGHAFFGTVATPPPAPYQNQLIVALLLGLLAALPTRTQEPPRAWIEFYAERGRGVDPHPLPGQRSRGE
jgi:hypothetical protein